MNEWAECEGKEHDRKVIDLLLAHIPTGKVEGTFNRAAYLPRRRQLALIWAAMLSDGLPDPLVLTERPSKKSGPYSRRRPPMPVNAEFRFPTRRSQLGQVSAVKIAANRNTSQSWLGCASQRLSREALDSVPLPSS